MFIVTPSSLPRWAKLARLAGRALCRLDNTGAPSWIAVYDRIHTEAVGARS